MKSSTRIALVALIFIALLVVAALGIILQTSVGSPAPAPSGTAVISNTQAVGVPTRNNLPLSTATRVAFEPTATRALRRTENPTNTPCPDGPLSCPSGTGGGTTVGVESSPIPANATADSTSENTPPAVVVVEPAPEQVTAIAALPVVARSASGLELGRGTLRLFAPVSMQPRQSFRVELELYFDALAITPTPSGDVTLVPVTTPKPTLEPADPQATPTRRHLVNESSDIHIFQKMGASLLCTPNSFDGCDARPDPATARLIPLGQPVMWQWLLSTATDAHGVQQLTAQVWTLLSEGATLREQIAWTHPFQIDIVPATVPAAGLPPVTLAGIVGVLLLALIGGAAIWRRRSAAKTPRVTRRAFISYRRKHSWSTARALRDRLVERGVDAFLDVENINEGRFAEIIAKEIPAREYFILILGPATLESDWVSREIELAIQTNRKIIPVLVDNFKFGDVALPDAMKTLSAHNAVPLTAEFFNEGIERVLDFMGIKARS